MSPTHRRRSRRRRLGLAFTALVAAAGLAAGTLFMVWGLLNNRFLDRLNREIARQARTPREQVLATFELVSQWDYMDPERLGSPLARWMARVEHASPLHVSARTTLTAGVDHSGPCGSLSRSMVVLLRRAGFRARKLILYSAPGVPQHTVVEVFLHGEWRVLDPTYGWYWTRPADGALATAEDLRDPQLLAMIRSRHPDYPLQDYHYDQVQRIRWEKIPGLTLVRSLLVRVWGEDRVRELQTPALYERPAFLLAGASLAVGVAALGGWAMLRRRDTGS